MSQTYSKDEALGFFSSLKETPQRLVEAPDNALFAAGWEPVTFEGSLFGSHIPLHCCGYTDAAGERHFNKERGFYVTRLEDGGVRIQSKLYE